MKDWTRHTGLRRVVGIGVLALVVSFAASAAAANPGDPADHPLLQPIDAQNWVDQGELTWADYKPVPDRKPAYYDPATEGTDSHYRTAIVLVDFPDQPFLISRPPGSHPFGNPQPGWTPVAPADVRQWMHEYYSEPNEFNGGMTLSSYWLEDTHGRIGVEPTTFGPYTMPADLHEFGLGQFNGNLGSQPDSSCPAGDTCNRDIRAAAGALWRAAIGCTTTLCGYDNIFYVTAGHDESSTWQEFGEMLWEEREDVPAAFGPPGAADGPVLNAAGNPIPNWAPTRYVPWSSWKAAANHWPNAGGGSSTQAESSGQSVFAHEFSHLRGLPDNYNNPFGDTDRNYTGYWEMMSRGTFNGPGGTHNRWQIPNAGGSALGPHHMLHFKNRLNTATSTILAADEQVFLERNTLATQGVAVVELQARSSAPDDGELVGLTVNFGTGGDAAGTCANQGYIGRHALLLPEPVRQLHGLPARGGRPGRQRLVRARSRRAALEEPHERDAERLDHRPEAAGHRDDRLLSAGRDSGGRRPRRPAPAQRRDVPRGHELGQRVRVRGHVQQAALLRRRLVARAARCSSTSWQCGGTTTATRSCAALTLGKPAKRGSGGTTGVLKTCTFPLRNTGAAGAAPFDQDVYRVSATSSSADWKLTLPNALAAAKAGGAAVKVDVHAFRASGATTTTVTLTATSESDPSKTATRTCDIEA